MISEKLISVVPLSSPTGILFYLDYVYQDKIIKPNFICTPVIYDIPKETCTFSEYVVENLDTPISYSDYITSYK